MPYYVAKRLVTMCGNYVRYALTYLVLLKVGDLNHATLVSVCRSHAIGKAAKQLSGCSPQPDTLTA